MIKYVSVITDYTYLLWQQELQIFNFKRLGILEQLVVVVLYDPGKPLSDHAKSLKSMAEVYYFENDQTDRSYIPSNKPWGLMKLLEAFPQYGEKLFLLDSDVVFREELNFSKIDQSSDDSTWYVSNCISYIGYEYLKYSLETDELVNEMAQIVGLDAATLKENQMNSGGAQYYMKNVTAEFCRQVAEDSIKIYRWACEQKKPDGSHKIQVWTAEMWSWLWHAFKIAKVQVSPEMKFSWAPHDILDWYFAKMLHLAGVVEAGKGVFYKGKYYNTCPWDVEEDFLWIDRSKSWGPYVELIEAYKPKPVKRGVVCYVDQKRLPDVQGLVQSWLDLNDPSTNLLLFGQPEVLAQIDDHPQLVKVVCSPHPFENTHPDINDIAMLRNYGETVLYSYTHLLKADSKTRLSQAWLRFLPDRFTIASGRNKTSEEFLASRSEKFKEYSLRDRGLFNLGSVFYGPTSQVIDVCKRAVPIAKFLIVDKDNLDIALSTEYALELVVNHLVPWANIENNILI